MTDISMKRISDILRLVFDLLWFEPQGLYASEIMRYIQSTVSLSEFESGYYPHVPHFPRYEVIIRVGTIPLVRAGWMQKNKNGLWLITDAGREACKRYKNSEDFFRESVRLFMEWNARESSRIAQLSSEPYNFAVENSWEQIQQYFATRDPGELRAMVSALVKALGLHIRWSASAIEKPEGGLVDLICHEDVLGLKPPRILVHIIDANQVATIDRVYDFVRSFTPGDMGLCFSFGGVTSQLTDFALAHPQIRVINLEQFVELWIANQDKIDLESKAKFPLKPIYFLSFQDLM